MKLTMTEATYIKRARIVGEIVSTEATYVKGLKTLKEVFMIPLQKDETVKVFLSEENYRTLFGNIDVIL
jgi:hypothetical protein